MDNHEFHNNIVKFFEQVYIHLSHLLSEQPLSHRFCYLKLSALFFAILFICTYLHMLQKAIFSCVFMKKIMHFCENSFIALKISSLFYIYLKLKASDKVRDHCLRCIQHIPNYLYFLSIGTMKEVPN